MLRAKTWFPASIILISQSAIVSSENQLTSNDNPATTRLSNHLNQFRNAVKEQQTGYVITQSFHAVTRAGRW